ncbi:MAG: bifunctional biotin--[acetyl-CoA-carboxylase] ligase/biotin operon repressor BirA [Porticoccaceae bacterium]|jgi:BirA family transcriptional regulator, biotin operon repressor / biotin---[acetyl-CoA-carboxylase] ligase|nr:bifunctional biotin--[acetyl-CoA-carboxylase] ligase/biotin operon repressor BirA [Porticoccaceae bacterium]
MQESQRHILEILKDGEFHSGEMLGNALGCSRTAVWKHLQKLEQLGLGVETVKGTGYRVAGGIELLRADKILSMLSPAARALCSGLEIFDTIDSTNRYAREMLSGEAASGKVILAEQQSAGRGRRGKTWISPFAANIYLSIRWDFERGAQALEGLSLAVGVAVKRALASQGVEGVQLKWPNDIYVTGKKLGGILLEMVGDPAGACSVIVGVGVNVKMPPEQGRRIDQDWTDVEAVLMSQNMPRRAVRSELVAKLVSEITVVLSDYQEKGFAAYRDEWQAADAFYGLRAAIITPKETITGLVRGVDVNGALCLECSDGRVETFIGGELSLRVQE